MSKSKIWESIADASARDLFDFALTLEAHFAMQRITSDAENPTDIADGELAAFLFETATDNIDTDADTPNLVEVKS